MILVVERLHQYLELPQEQDISQQADPLAPKIVSNVPRDWPQHVITSQFYSFLVI